MNALGFHWPIQYWANWLDWFLFLSFLLSSVAHILTPTLFNIKFLRANLSILSVFCIYFPPLALLFRFLGLISTLMISKFIPAALLIFWLNGIHHCKCPHHHRMDFLQSPKKKITIKLKSWFCKEFKCYPQKFFVFQRLKSCLLSFCFRCLETVTYKFVNFCFNYHNSVCQLISFQSLCSSAHWKIRCSLFIYPQLI